MKEHTISKPPKKSVLNLEVSVLESGPNSIACTMRKKDIELLQSEKMGQLVSKMLEGCNSGKATIKIEIEFSK